MVKYLNFLIHYNFYLKLKNPMNKRCFYILFQSSLSFIFPVEFTANDIIYIYSMCGCVCFSNTQYLRINQPFFIKSTFFFGVYYIGLAKVLPIFNLIKKSFCRGTMYFYAKKFAFEIIFILLYKHFL